MHFYGDGSGNIDFGNVGFWVVERYGTPSCHVTKLYICIHFAIDNLLLTFSLSCMLIMTRKQKSVESIIIIEIHHIKVFDDNRNAILHRRLRRPQ